MPAIWINGVSHWYPAASQEYRAWQAMTRHQQLAHMQPRQPQPAVTPHEVVWADNPPPQAVDPLPPQPTPRRRLNLNQYRAMQPAGGQAVQGVQGVNLTADQTAELTHAAEMLREAADLVTSPRPTTQQTATPNGRQRNVFLRDIIKAYNRNGDDGSIIDFREPRAGEWYITKGVRPQLRRAATDPETPRGIRLIIR